MVVAEIFDSVFMHKLWISCSEYVVGQGLSRVGGTSSSRVFSCYDVCDGWCEQLLWVRVS